MQLCIGHWLCNIASLVILHLALCILHLALQFVHQASHLAAKIPLDPASADPRNLVHTG